MTKHLDAFTPEQLQEVALAETAGIGHEQDREDAAQDFILGALEAQARAKEGGATRALQWSYGRGYVKKFIAKNRRKLRNRCILDTPIGDDEETVAAFIPDNSPALSDTLEESERTHRLRLAVKTLPENQRSIIEAIYFAGKTQVELADERGVSKQAIQQAERSALEKLRLAIPA